jgi:hypothetical protein
MDANGSMSIEELWGALLSREAELIQSAYSRLAKGEQRAVLAHLHRMAEEEGWHPEQRRSAEAAIKVLS